MAHHGWLRHGYVGRWVVLVLGLGGCGRNGGGADEAPTAKVESRLNNGSFDTDVAGWWGTANVENAMVWQDGQLCVTVPGGLANPWDALVGQSALGLTPGTAYDFGFTASASQPAVIRAVIGEPADPWTEFAAMEPELGADPRTERQSFIMGATAQEPQLAFQIGGAATDTTYCFDDVTVDPLVNEFVVNGSFDDGLVGWWWYGDALVDVDASSGALCAVTNPSANIWEAGIGQSLGLLPGGTYALSLRVQGDPQPIEATVGNPTTNEQYVRLVVEPTADPTRYSAVFTTPASASQANLVLLVAGSDVPRSFCIDDVSLLSNAVYTPDTGPRVRVNQVAYLPLGPKLATVVTAATDPLPWQLDDAEGDLVASGGTMPFGTDVSSGLTVHRIDFSNVHAAGAGYTLQADGETSYPFAIDTAPYERLRADAFAMYYTQRSGEAIDGNIAGAAYARPAGHVSSPADGALNQGDRDVPCQPADDSLAVYGEPWTCDYTLDVTGGWYDAGDQGKYVVNGGLSVYLLLNTFERTKSARSADWGALGDGSLRIPEANNRIPDVLDEVRHELEFFLAMQVPDGQPLAGMVHHKVHDNAWTNLPQMPHTDPRVRWLHRPSTAATLNLAATAAQAARFYAPYDRGFASRLLRASQRAWEAAREHPALYAPFADGYSGGGAYEDDDVSDEFYWAAAELYLTTGRDLYRNFLLASPHHAGPVFIPEGFLWNRVAALGRLDLATVPSRLPGRAAVIQSVVDAGRAYRADEAANGFGQPYRPRDGVYVWGSNAQVLNNLVVLGTAYDLSGDLSLGDAVAEGVDYLLGRNALNISFVTGYGTVFSENEHSRIYAHQLDPSLPRPPIGTITAGPDSQTEWWDPTTRQLFARQGCAPQFCYVDDIMSGATNELTINLNAPLAWVASFLADQNSGRPQVPRCTVDWHYVGSDVGGLHARLTVHNDGPRPLVGHALSWAFFGDQSVVRVPAGVVVDQAGATVTIRPTRSTWRLGPFDTVAFELTVDRGHLASPEPGTFYLNGQACRSR